MAAPIRLHSLGPLHSKSNVGGLGYKPKANCTIEMDDHIFEIPKKAICKPDDMRKWESSQAYDDLVGFILAMNEAVKSKKLTDAFHVSNAIEKLATIISKMDAMISDYPPIDQPQRFGNKAFRLYYEKLKEDSESLVKQAIDEKFHKSVPEISVYLVESVGNSTRIDYGTGHEMSFAVFMCCLFKLGILVESDAVAAVLKIFNSYIDLVRKLQTTYRMEPAGSQGAWSLDDYQFIPFIWGSSQLLVQGHIMPSDYPKEEIIQKYHSEYMFLSCLKYINSVKSGPFAEHSNQLWSISAVPYWSKVNSGLIKMYKAEILAKFPVIQHFLFGTLMSVQPTETLKT